MAALPLRHDARPFRLPATGERFQGRWLIRQDLGVRRSFRRFEALDERDQSLVELRILPNPTGAARSIAHRFLTQCRDALDHAPVSFLTVDAYGCDEVTGSVWAILPRSSTSSAPFQLTSILHHGSTTVLLAGVHTTTTTPVAIKVLRRSFLHQSTALARFHRERDLAERLRSPHFPAFIAHGECNDGRPFFAIERESGRSLGDLISNVGPIAVDLARRIARGVGAALGVAHDEGVIHRDVTPANIFLARSAQNDEDVKLIDFGIAGVPDHETNFKVSQAGRFVGTPAHCAPEQFFGFGIDAKADVYGLASTLYEALTGRPPFTVPVHALVEAKVKAPPPNPSQLRPELKHIRGLDNWLVAPLHPNPEERPTLREWCRGPSGL